MKLVKTHVAYFRVGTSKRRKCYLIVTVSLTGTVESLPISRKVADALLASGMAAEGN